jgi:hypothetical protein
MPDDLVLTPGGYKPRGNVHHVPPEHAVRMNGDLFEIHHRTRGFVRSVGRIQRHASTEPLMPNNIAHRPDPAKPFTNRGPGVPGADGEVDGWLSFAGWTNATGAPISFFSTDWTVPEAPQNTGDQTIFLFNGIQNATMIYQPVLQWGISAAGGGQKWSVGCWYADSPDGHSFYSLLVDVAPGTKLTGSMSLADQSEVGCSYTAQFIGVAETALPIFNVDELTWANETLEAYKVKTRADLPDSAKTVFSSIVLKTGAAVPTVNWSRTNYYPALGTAATVTVNSGDDGEIEISY